jgi:hypothetical protein
VTEATTPSPEPRHLGDVRVVVALAALAAVLAAVVQVVVFPHGSINNDEAIYRLQAQAIQHGHFFIPLVPPAGAFRPWLAALVQHHWVLKYIPVEAILLAVAGAVTGTPAAILPVVAAAAAAATWLLVGEVLEDRKAAIVATLLVVVSPLVVVQSALLVGYLPTLALLEVFAWTVIRTTRRPNPRLCVLGGLAVGLAGIARPYDTALFAIPVGVWAVIRLRRRIVNPLGWYVLGVVPPLAAMLVYDWAATGSPLKLPFNLLEPADKPGFGPRRMFPQEPYHAFGLRLGIRGSSNHLLLTALWVAGGPLLVLLALVGLWRRRRSGPARVLAAVAVAFPVGYVFFWGAWNASALWHGVRFIGPFYFLPLVVPIAAFGGAELVALYRRWRSLAAAVVVVGLVSSALVAAPAVAADARWSRQDGTVLALVGRQVTSSRPALVFIQSNQEYVMHPISGLANRWDGAGPLVYGLWSGTTQDLTVLASQPGRQPFVLTLFGPFEPHPAHLAATLRPITTKSGPSVTLHVTAASVPGTAAGQSRVGPTVDASPTAAGASPTAVASAVSCPDTTGGGWDVTVGGDGRMSCAAPGGSPATGAVVGAVPAGGAWEGGLRLRSGTGSSLTVGLRLTGGIATVVAVGAPVGSVGSPPIDSLTAE